MNATKRKFNALLQGLNTPPAAQKTMDHEALLQKRRRLGFPESTAPKLDGMSTGITNIVSSLKRPAQGASAVLKEVPARYSPNDRDELLRRLATFQEITDWTPKPDKINEVEWAKRGWVCRGKEKVRCLLCHKELIVKLKEADEKVEDAAGLEEALVDKYAELIITCHQSDCLWRRQGCDGSLLRLSFSSTKTVMEALKQRYEELCSRQSFLPYEFNIRLPEGMDLDSVIQQLPSDFFCNSEANRPALALALLGWQGLTDSHIGAVPNSASCHTCLRRLGLWIFKSKEVDEQGHVIVPAPMDHLDPVREHRFFCPWKNGSAQCRRNAGPRHVDEATWEVLLQAIKNDSDLRGVYEGRAKTPTSRPARQAVTAPNTPARASGVEDAPDSPAHGTAASLHALDEDEALRNAKDKERWARLRKVKSLFDTKKLKRSMTIRPGTSESNKSAK